jgi:hypothetical protein
MIITKNCYVCLNILLGIRLFQTGEHCWPNVIQQYSMNVLYSLVNILKRGFSMSMKLHANSSKRYKK